LTVVPPRRWLAIAAAVAAHGFVILSVAGQSFDAAAPPTARRFVTARLHFDAVTWPGPGADFFALYHAGVQVRRGQSPYQQQENPRITPYFFRYIYSSLLAETLGRLVTVTKPVTAYRLWLVVVEACLLMCLATLWRRSRDTRSTTAASILLLLSQPYFLELHMGQFTFVAAALTLLAATLIDRAAPHRYAAVPLLAVAGLLKTFPFVTLPALVRHRRRWPAVWAAVVTAATVGLWTRFGHGGLQYLTAFALADEFDGPHPGAFSALQAFFVVVSSATGTWLPRTFPALPLIVMGLLLAWTAACVLHSRRDDVVLESTVLLLAFFLGFLHCWEHHYSAVLLAGVFLLDRIASDRPPFPAATPLLVVALALIAAPTPFALLSEEPARWSAGGWLLLSLSKALPTLVVFAVGVRALREPAISSVGSRLPVNRASDRHGDFRPGC